MRNKRLVWQIFPTFLIISLVALYAAGWLASRSFEDFFQQRVHQELLVRDRLVSTDVARLLTENKIAELDAFVRPYASRTETRYTIIKTDGVVVFDSEESPAKMANHADREEIRAALEGHAATATRYSETLRQRMMYSAVPVEQDGKLLGVIRTALPLTVVDEIAESVRHRFLASGLFVALVTAIVSWFMARRITQPIEAMQQGAERFARGDLDYKLPIPESIELADLAKSLNSMATQLEDRIQTILRQSSEQNAVLASMVEGVLAVDSHERIITMNTAAALLLDCNRQRALGCPAQDFISSPELRKFVTHAITCDEPIQQDVTCGADHQRVIQARGTALGDGKQRRGAVIVLNDVTNMRRLENLRRDFVANVSHELKTPITSIKGFVETLLDGALDHRADAERFLGIVGKQADRLAAIVDDLLSLAKIEQDETEAELDVHSSDVRDVIQVAITSCMALAKERDVHVQFPEGPPVFAEINPPLLEQAVTNLLDNAIKYSGAQSEVVVSAQATASEILISVRDQGVGIEAEHLPRLFERFYRVDKARSRKVGGTGLGLAIVKHIVNAHRGRVSVESRSGAGSTFTIHLPKRRNA